MCVSCTGCVGENEMYVTSLQNGSVVSFAVEHWLSPVCLPEFGRVLVARVAQKETRVKETATHRDYNL